MALPPEARRPKKKIRRKPGTSSGGGGGPQGTGRIAPPRPAPKAGPPTPRRLNTPAKREAERKKIIRRRTAGPPTPKKLRGPIRQARERERIKRDLPKGRAGDTKSDADRRLAEDYVRRQYIREHGPSGGTVKSKSGETIYGYRQGSTVPPDVQKRVDKSNLRKHADAATADRTAPVLKVLEQTTRPLHAVAAAAREDVRDVKAGRLPVGQGSLKAAKRGLQNKDKSTFSDVLAEAGVKNKAVKGAVGFALDVALDPTTYVTGGTGTIARKAAVDAAKKAERKARKAGLTTAQVKRMGDRAAKQAAQKAPEGRGLTIRAAGREVPGVRKGTAKAGRAVGRVTDKPKVLRKTKDRGRHVVADFNPQITPDNISREAYREVRRATRTARSSTAREISKTKLKAEALRKQVGEADQEILDAIESGSLKGLSAEKRQVAKRLQDQFKYARRTERRAGIKVGEVGGKHKSTDPDLPKGYVPHALKEPLEKGQGIQSVGAKVIRPGFGKGREERRRLAVIRKEAPEKYSEDTALLYANRMVESAVASNKAKLNRRLLDIGRRVRRGDEVEIGDGEKVFRIVGSDVKELEKGELQRFVDTGDGGKGGQYVVLNEQTVNRAIKQVVPSGERSAVGQFLDRTQGGWKWLATVPNPGFHVRNLVGDAQNAYLAEPARKVARNTGQSARALKRVGAQEEALRKGKPLALKQAGVKIGDRKVSYDELIGEAEKVGAIRAGFINREIPDLVKAAPGVRKPRKVTRIAKKGVMRPERTAKRFLQNREDLFRLATYIGARKRGLDPEKAAERASKFHFDYADLTEVERKVARRLMPFYTFSARNIPLQLTSFFAKPGKYAQYQKIREETAKAFGVDLQDAEAGTAEYEQRAAPVYVKWKGEEFTLSFGPSGLPLTDLNEMPVSTNMAKAADEWMSRAMSLVTPVAKTPVEMWSNFSFFFRDQIERETGPLVSMSSALVKTIPLPLRDELGIVPDFVDPRSGKKGWAWPAKHDYVARILPGPFNYINRVTTASDRRGQGTVGKTVAYFGLRAAPVERVSKDLQGAYEKRSEVGKSLASLRQRANRNGEKISAENPTAEYTKLLVEHRRLTDQIEAGRIKRGDKVIRKRGRPKKPGVSWQSAPGDVKWESEGTGDVTWGGG